MALELEARAAALIPLDLSLRAEPGELLALVGPSGSGKTTLLRMIAGLWRPPQGRVRVAGRVWLDSGAGVMLPPHRRRVGMVFQDYALFPHMTAAGNVMAAMDRPDPVEAARLLALVDLAQLGGRRPAQLSGGQQQRVALARALARRPEALLLDEPFAAVDHPVRARLHAQIIALRAHFSMPVVLVTHDLAEAQLLADRMVVIEGGRALAQGTTAEVMADPAALRVLGLADPVSVLPGVVRAHLPGGLTALDGPAGPLLVPALAAPPGARVRLRIGAREILLTRAAPETLAAPTVLPVRIAALRVAAGTAELTLLARDQVLLCRLPAATASGLGLRPGERLHAILTAPSVSVSVTPVGGG